ncbi:hypothetical protein QJS10_CPB18g01102 [Acorus calamus]|uniref:Nucleoside phosphorylase domain-containing protein n=1 Tax=Acorus calamus TaxID=4465 RepID=A0AAV9CN07_ACOCL|nr:hypothetical protein QJS10_CPB18g01102 [Acorus calamus]
MGDLKVVLIGLIVLFAIVDDSEAAISVKAFRRIIGINRNGPYLGLVVPNSFEMSHLLQSSLFVEDERFPQLDFEGRRFRIGRLGKEKVIVVMTGLSMLNAGVSTQLLLTLFKIKGVVHFGIAGNADPNLQIGDVTIPRRWTHTGLWYWQRFGDGPNDELALESSGDYTRIIGYLNVSDYTTMMKVENGVSFNSSNYLNSVWYQSEEIFPVEGTPEVRQHAFWVPVDSHYFALSEKLEGMRLEGCVNATTCLPRRPKVVRVGSGCSANVFVDNASYRQFLRSKFGVTPIDMETAAVALVCRQQGTPFIALRSLSDLAGGGSAQSNEANIYAPLAAQNAVDAVVHFVQLLSH